MYSILTHYCRFLSKNSQVPKNYHFFLNSFVHSASYRLNVKILMVIFVGLDWVWTYASNVHSRIYQIQVGLYIYSFCYVIARTTKASSTKLSWVRVNSTSQIEVQNLLSPKKLSLFLRPNTNSNDVLGSYNAILATKK